MKLLVRLLAFILCAVHPLGVPAVGKEPPSPTIEALSQTLTESQRSALLTLLNEGDAAALQAIPGIGLVRATAIAQQRPFATVTDVLRVEGVGEGTFAKMIAHAQAGFPQKQPARRKSSGETPKSSAEP